MHHLRTLRANLDHGARSNTPAHVGGGEFSPHEQRMALIELTTRDELLAEARRILVAVKSDPSEDSAIIDLLLHIEEVLK